MFGATLLNAMIETGNFLYIGMHGALDKNLYVKHNRIMKSMYEDFVTDCELLFKEKYGEDKSLFPEEDNSLEDEVVSEDKNNSLDKKQDNSCNVSSSGKRVVKVKRDMSSEASKESVSDKTRLSGKRILRKKRLVSKKN
jgi:hypothetical protein